MSRVLLVGDTHFKSSTLAHSKEFCDNIISIATSTSPDFIVLLGDILDSHEIVRTKAYNVACNFIENLSKVSPVFVLIGNHDYTSNSQFLTEEHCFNPLKKWRNVTIVDKPILRTCKSQSFIFCPYTPPGRFIEALNTMVSDGEMWEFSDAIFCHQEFLGAQYGMGMVSVIGDEWQSDYPDVFSGHMHTPHRVGEKINYVGSSQQTKISESPDKKVWLVSFDEGERRYSIKKHPTGVRNFKKIVKNVSDISEENVDKITRESLKYKIHLVITGENSLNQVFKSTGLAKSLKKLVWNLTYINTDTDEYDENDVCENTTTASFRSNINFGNVLKRILSNKDDSIKKLYEENTGESIGVVHDIEDDDMNDKNITIPSKEIVKIRFDEESE